MVCYGYLMGIRCFGAMWDLTYCLESEVRDIRGCVHHKKMVASHKAVLLCLAVIRIID